ncbi:putative cysteine-rich repeat secretory protein 17 [Raphanus sativus]|uniref:Cysteine-rich repeat secretory protein 17 n=1 Tax=Raphanus sativus TaxID=3726 RepID=A0A6J0LMN4_RAPSA|nr:putative cysteine-rich repeat secretory protein 17 [Raphanus sativus]KAJ4894255.1 putative cysteine-rich repeat secretory protein 17 [Raphanus sativus]
MYSASSVIKRLILIHVFAIQLLPTNSDLSLNTTNEYLNHKCLVNQGKYKPGSEYEDRLKRTIKMIYSGSNKGYDGIGDPTFSAILQCRGDSYGPKCHDCFATALSALGRRCPWYKGRIIWYDQCLLAISTFNTIGKIDYDNNFCMSNAKKVGGDIGSFIIAWNNLIQDLTTFATSGDNYTLYSVGETRYKGDMLYGMVQCTKGLSPKACEECVSFNSLHFQDCLNTRRGGRVVGLSCNFRLEFYPFIAEPVRNI